MTTTANLIIALDKARMDAMGSKDVDKLNEILGEDLIAYPEMPGCFSFLSDENIYEAWSERRQWYGNTDAFMKGIDSLHRPLVRSFRRANMAVITAWPLIDEPFEKDMAPVAIFIEFLETFENNFCQLEGVTGSNVELRIRWERKKNRKQSEHKRKQPSNCMPDCPLCNIHNLFGFL